MRCNLFQDDDEDDIVENTEGFYNPREYDNLPVDPDVRNLFKFISKYRAQSIILGKQIDRQLD